MDTEIDWQRELDSSFGAGADVPAGHYVAAGQRAVRRRRQLAAVLTTAALVLVGGVVWSTSPGSAPRSEAPVATQPPPSASASASPTPSTKPARSRDMPWRKNEPPARALLGELEIRPGAVVHERRDALYPGKDTESAALDISFGGSRWWLVLEWDRGGSSMSSTRPEDGFADSFDAFVRAEVATGGMTSMPADDVPGMGGGLVTWRGGELDPAPGVEVVERVENPVPGDESLGLVLRSEGQTTWMLLSQGGLAASWTLEPDSGWATFDQWIADQVAVQTGSPGVRLVRLADDGTITATAPSVEVLDQRADPDLAGYGTGEDRPSAVAMLDWAGERWFVLAVGFSNQVAVTTVAASKAPGVETLDEFIAFMADKADEGGMR